MKNTLILLTFITLVSCGRPTSSDVGHAHESDQQSADSEAIKDSKKVTKLLGTGTITTIADGYDVKRVNLFSSTGSDRTINCFLSNGDKVNVIESAEPYYLVETADGRGCRGYCMKEFVVLKK